MPYGLTRNEPIPEWKRRMWDSARRCRLKIKALEERGIEPSTDKIEFVPLPYQRGQSYYVCPLCKTANLLFDHDPHGHWNDACSNEDCNYYHLDHVFD